MQIFLILKVLEQNKVQSCVVENNYKWERKPIELAFDTVYLEFGNYNTIYKAKYYTCISIQLYILVYSWFPKDSWMRSIKKSKTISSSIGGLKLNKSCSLYVKIIWIFTKNPKWSKDKKPHW